MPHISAASQLGVLIPGLAPDWVCEVLSLATALHDRKRQMKVHAKEQVSFS